ncbi:Retrovirus-related Pol polyprotein from type-2 retrotransposable element R2DM; Endonuclease [Eumeta japonica]|uniref:Retrovirus-related Pol polyprotein from type-2 retrotransposable element R2DM Endonuclease n=1 Tax=Eumeta variegata TaxID=151549 RepID=A0A4C1S9X6_EUMVA|nr:Retrovirus-related Pol polyprotein from type-2 retrotransposable element R2DM; Endonuclease [Eumeta japonica]
MEDNEDIPEILIPEVEKAIRSQKQKSSWLEENQPVEQAGFRKDYSTIDHIHTIKQLLQKYNEYNKTIYLAFIDYSKAFDSLKHESVWQSLKEQGIRNAYINIIKNIYRESKACIRLESTGDVFPINRGVRQETHSPKLFTAVLEQMFRKLNWEHLGLIINGARLNHLRFADDLVIMEEDPLLLEFMTQSLVERSREVGLEINISKTKMMTNSVPVDITINGQKLDKVPERHGEEHARFETIGQRKKYRHQKKTKVTDILSRIDQLKWRWAGHMLRCKRRNGVSRALWTRVAADRQQWKELEEAFAVRHTEIRDIL